MGCKMIVPNTVPPAERPSVESCVIVPWNVPAFRRQQNAQYLLQDRAVPVERSRTKSHQFNQAIFNRSVPVAPLESGTVERSLARAVSVRQEQPAACSRLRADALRPERRAGERRQKRASKHLFCGIRVLTFKTASTRCLRLTAPRAASPIGEALRLTPLRPWLLPVAFCVAGSKRKAINRVWRSSVPSSYRAQGATREMARCLASWPTKRPGWVCQAPENHVTVGLSGVCSFSRPFLKILGWGSAA